MLIDLVKQYAELSDRQYIGVLTGRPTYRWFEHLASATSIVAMLQAMLTPSAVWTGDVPAMGEPIELMTGVRGIAR